MMGQEPLLGVIYDFNRDECFSALSTGPLCLNGVLQQPRWAQELPLACLMTGFRPPRDAQGEARMLEFWRKIQGFKKVRMIGTAALAVAYVAVGWADAYYEEGIYLWDVAAGLALVKAAGGHVHWTPTTRGPLCLNVWAFGAPGWTQNIIQSDGPICV